MDILRMRSYNVSIQYLACYNTRRLSGICRIAYLAFSKVADTLLPIAPKPTPTARPSGIL